jgi:hypothetical protein
LRVLFTDTLVKGLCLKTRDFVLWSRPQREF